MGGTLVQDEEAIKRIEELIVSDRASTMLVCIQGTREGEPWGGNLQLLSERTGIV